MMIKEIYIIIFILISLFIQFYLYMKQQCNPSFAIKNKVFNYNFKECIEISFLSLLDENKENKKKMT